MANDTANGVHAMVATIVAAPAQGTVVLAGNGSFAYTPRSGFSGTDTFTYRVTTLSGGPSAPAYVAITVGAAAGARPPLAAADAYATMIGTALIVPAARGLLANDDAVGGASLTAQLVTSPAHGALSLSADGGFTYTPAGGYAGTDSFTYRPAASGGAGDPVNVAISVTGAGRPLAPSHLRIVAIAGNRVSLAWTVPTSGPLPTGILIEGGDRPDAVIAVLAPLGATSAATVTLPTGSFYLRVRATTSAGLSGPSNEVLAHVNAPVAPSAPAALLGVVNGQAVHLAWRPTFGGGAPTGARVDVTGSIVTSFALGAADTFSYPTAPGGTYTFTVRQTNAAGTSAPSAPVTLTVPGTCAGAPQAPVGANASWTGSELLVQWDPPRSGPAPTSYTVQVAGALTGSVTTTNRSIAAPMPRGSYSITVVATNACGGSAGTAAPAVTVP